MSDGVDHNALLGAVVGVEAQSEHPIARAIVDAAMAEGPPITAPDSFEALAGMGIKAHAAGQDLLIDAARLMTLEGIKTGEFEKRVEALASAGQTAIYVAQNGKIAAIVGVSDPVKPSARQTVDALKSYGLRVVMITGDGQATADAVAHALGIDDVVADVMPDGKRAAIIELQRNGKVGFVGDGTNDAPALAQADVGIAIGTGTDVAIETTDVVLTSGDTTGVVKAFAISRTTMRNIRQNLFWAFAYDVTLYR
ncbi:HAD-IC family P-type ATPase [Sulfitobacter sp. SK012]|uniref:HAD-IC family P-type ATPase n=1 Tax=Sulfitobacter sp. SK012 TaxID=1389005 RepID=UPI0020C790F1|nr:HAD-IC family P-type ATPase [Sulfitobacter sp. SK012]